MSKSPPQGEDEFADSRVVKTIRQLKRQSTQGKSSMHNVSDVDTKTSTSSERESYSRGLSRTEIRTPLFATKNGYPRPPSARKPPRPSIVAKQLTAVYEAIKSKSLDAASKSVEIHDFCLEKQVELKFMLDKLFQDHFFKNVCLSLPQTLFSNSRKLEKFILEQIVGKYNELANQKILHDSLISLNMKIVSRIKKLKEYKSKIDHLF